jgi:hypothetical protein
LNGLMIAMTSFMNLPPCACGYDIDIALKN